MRALIYTRVGWSERDSHLRHAGLQAYGAALGALQKALRKPGPVIPDETIIAAMSLGLYEVLYPPSRWQAARTLD